MSLTKLTMVGYVLWDTERNQMVKRGYGLQHMWFHRGHALRALKDYSREGRYKIVQVYVQGLAAFGEVGNAPEQPKA